jgi:hypothetical protein
MRKFRTWFLMDDDKIVDEWRTTTPGKVVANIVKPLTATLEPDAKALDKWRNRHYTNR